MCTFVWYVGVYVCIQLVYIFSNIYACIYMCVYVSQIHLHIRYSYVFKKIFNAL